VEVAGVANGSCQRRRNGLLRYAVAKRTRDIPRAGSYHGYEVFDLLYAVRRIADCLADIAADDFGNAADVAEIESFAFGPSVPL
jgi:hypothetical protein